MHIANRMEPKALGKNSPMLYARLADDGKTFEPQRNVITKYAGLDGGASIAADNGGNVFVAWHAPTSKGAGEAARRVWVSRSTDDGKTFAPETALSSDSTGVCGCCGMRIAVAGAESGRFGCRSRLIPASAGVRPPFLRLQLTQQVTMFSQSFRPPCATGTTWSKVRSGVENAFRQYWHVW